MIRLNIAQGSPEWITARIGIPTASQFSKILTPKTMKLSASADGYLCELVAEWMLGASLDDYRSDWMDRGIEMEESAVRYYELQRECDVEEVGLLLRDDGKVGCSPDRLVGDDGGLEIKCPSPAVHVANLLDMPSKHMTQVQGALWITGRQWWDLLSYHPELPPALVRIPRNEGYIAALEMAVDQFIEKLEETREEMVRRGYVKAKAEKGAA